MKQIAQIRHLPAIFLMLVILLIGLSVFKDYGFPWDEIYQLNLSHLAYNYINHTDVSLLTYEFKYLGTGTELMLIAFYQLFPSLGEVYARHLGVFFFYLSGLLSIYLIGYRLYKNQWWAFLCMIIFLLSPRIYGDAFFNSKDIPFMVTFSLSIYCLMILLDALNQPIGKTLIRCLFLSFSTALCISTRVAGILILFICAGIFLVGLFSTKSHKKMYIFFLYVLLTIGFTIFFNPASWANPIQHFCQSIYLYSRVPSSLMILFTGQIIHARSLPWYYLPVWIGITTPIIVILGFLFSQISIAINVIYLITSSWDVTPKNLVNTIFTKRDWLILALWLYLPIIVLYVFNSTINDGWRHMFFIYPPIVLFTVFGIQTIFRLISNHPHRNKFTKIVVGMSIFAGLLEPLCFMSLHHPHQNVYFSPLAGDYSTIRFRYEMDYWGLSYKQGIDAILKFDSRKHIKLFVVQPAGAYYVKYMLNDQQKTRLEFVDNLSSADYFITEYRFHPQDYPLTNKVFEVNIQGMEILAVYNLDI